MNLFIFVITITALKSQSIYNRYSQIDIDFDDPLFEKLFSVASKDLSTKTDSVYPLSAYSLISNGIIVHFVLVVYNRNTFDIKVYERAVHFKNLDEDQPIDMISHLEQETPSYLLIHDKRYIQLFNEVYKCFNNYIKNDSMKHIDTIEYYEGLSPLKELHIYIVKVNGTLCKRMFIYSRLDYNNENIFMKEFELHK